MRGEYAPTKSLHEMKYELRNLAIIKQEPSYVWSGMDTTRSVDTTHKKLVYTDILKDIIMDTACHR